MDPERARELLDRKRRRIERSLAERREPVGTGELSNQDQHLADAGADLHEQELEEGLTEQLEAELDALERAEARLAAGIYGISVESRHPILDERLEANPLAERTIEEERRFESG